MIDYDNENNINNENNETQRRNFYRPNCFLKSKYRIIDNDDGQKCRSQSNFDYKETSTRNISIQGACIVADEDIPISHIIEIIIFLTDNIKIKAKCNVIRSIKLNFGGREYFEIGMFINDISQVDRDILVKYITENVTVKERLINWEDPYK